ncbi:MAG: 30S ribosomal protein S6 [Lactobacillales bacterium]|jgi:small subunit ribosomal protein S6|nr:30S ribosomal protein S6 [Lactobacillales bacterium]MDR1253571.1 30S ribosomal protein S6 [Oscillospiraceae bacterium]
MSHINNAYETVIVFSLKSGEEAIATLLQKFKDLISSNGEIESVDEWGRRKLAYPIRKETEGHYVLFNFTSNAEFPAELDRIYKITDGVLRSLIVKKEG